MINGTLKQETNQKERINCYHFIPGNKIELIEKVKKYFNNNQFKIILDLEDAVTDIFDSDKANKIKINARTKISKYFQTKNEGEYYIRLNNPRSKYWQEDINFLKRLENIDAIKGFIIPKTETVEDIDTINEHVKSIYSKELSIIPLIESKAGLKNLKRIVRERNVSKLIFGHHDYFYDVDIFPIPSSPITSQEYRNTLSAITEVIKNKNIELIDGIAPQFNNTNELNNICEYLNQSIRGPTGKLSVHLSHIETILNFRPHNQYVLLNNINEELTNKEKNSLAHKIIDVYTKKSNDLGITKLNDVYISPQMYLSSIKYLKQEVN